MAKKKAKKKATKKKATKKKAAKRVTKKKAAKKKAVKKKKATKKAFFLVTASVRISSTRRRGVSSTSRRSRRIGTCTRSRTKP